MSELEIAVEDPRTPDVRSVLQAHLSFARAATPICDAHALDVDGLLDPTVTLFSARRGGVVVGIGALRELDATHGEIKSMHTTEEVRGQGIGRAMVNHILVIAAHRGYQSVSLETGAMEAFASARALYASLGFEPCPPFGEYTDNPNSACMTITIGSREH